VNDKREIGWIFKVVIFADCKNFNGNGCKGNDIA
jgi:hypothetical protein